jgi:polyhydroxyalkanoate synthesis regulator phasin
VAAQSRGQSDGGVADALRAAVDRTLSAAGRPARAGTPGLTRERATQLLDEVAKLGRDAREELARRGQGARDELTRRGQGARDELTRRGQDAGAELARRGQGAAEEMAQRLEALERRLAALEDALRKPSGQTKPKAEG